ncbi:MAG: matrixin family metalloprotease [Candidatus Bathyarchaeia archaeon]
MTRRRLILVSLTVALLLNSPVPYVASQTQYTILLGGLTWDHTILQTLVVPQPSQSWWRPAYLNATLRAINQWNHAILDFSSLSASFAYLSRVRFSWTVSDSMEAGYDVYITWTEVYEGTHTLGSAQATYLQPCTILKYVVQLGARVTEGLVLSESDMQNVALHELGHVLGLGHSNYQEDVMAPRYAIGSRVRAISNLDLYAVAEVFRWASRPLIPGITGICPRVSSVTLPPGEEFRFLPISSADLPPQAYWETLLDRVQTVLSRYLTVTLVVFTVALIGLSLIAVGLRRLLRRPPETAQPAANPPGATAARR